MKKEVTLWRTHKILPAAHCILQKDKVEALLPRDILVFFGAHILSNPLEPERYSLSPKAIILHDDWNSKTAQYDGDMALLEFEQNSIKFNNFVQPICLLFSENAASVTEGIVTGWGKSEDPTRYSENVPKLVRVTIYTNDECLPGETTLASLSSHRTFCAGHNKGSGVCFGDSGGGLVIEIGGIFHLKGIVSSSQDTGRECDVSKNAVYTDVYKFMNG